ncbi:MAG: hypothetical protein MUE41_11075, partial [Gemmatimonadaceae bacterium]|nr:hypothetical protein [Gemmatimonadaceae bacterium]
LEGRPSIAPRVSLLRPHRGAMRALVRRVLDVLSTRTRVRWVPDVIERLEPRGAGVVVHLDHTVVAFDGWCAAATPDRLLLLLGHHPPSMPRGESRATVVCATVRAEADAAPLHVALDPALPLTVAVQPMAMDGRVPVTLDWSRRAAGVPDEVIAVASREALLRLGLADRDAHIDILRVRHLHSTAAPPTPEVIDAHRRAHAALRTVAGSAVLLGAAAPAMGVSPADDLGLGLQAATRLDGTAGGHGLAPRASRTSTPRALVVEERAPRVSVLLTLSGASAGTSAALHALLAQGVRDVEVVAVPLADASRAREAIAQFGARHPELPLTMFSGTSDGSPAAWMARAVSRSRAPVLVALDADDTLVPTALADAVQRLEAEPTLDAVFGDRLVPNGGHTVLKAVPAGGALDLSGRPRAGAWRRSLWTRVGGWREGALDPSRDFWVAAALAGATGASLGVPFVATPDAGDRAASLLLGHDLAARAEIVVARAAGFDSATVAVASALRAGLPVSRLVAVERPAPILVEGFVDWGDAAAIAGSLQDLVRAWDASRRYAADATTDAR